MQLTDLTRGPPEPMAVKRGAWTRSEQRGSTSPSPSVESGAAKPHGNLSAMWPHSCPLVPAIVFTPPPSSSSPPLSPVSPPKPGSLRCYPHHPFQHHPSPLPVQPLLTGTRGPLPAPSSPSNLLPTSCPKETRTPQSRTRPPPPPPPPSPSPSQPVILKCIPRLKPRRI